jgi:glycosyltransferase involved in cell wall biosynthesis
MKSSYPFISVIIPVYNVERFFEKCIRSLFEQTLEYIEYIFVNDSTCDNSMKLLDEILQEYPKRKGQVRIINHEHNMGLGAARKSGLKAATGKYIIHCDSDDWIDVDMYEKLYAKAVEKDADIVCCGFYMEYAGKRIKRLPQPSKKSDKALLKNLKWDVLYSSVWSKLVKKSLYDNYNISPFSGINMWEDVGLMTRLRYFSAKTVIVYEALYHYNRQNDSSLISVPKISSVDEQIHCANMLENFFLEQHAGEEFFLLIQNMKFMSKEMILFNKALRNQKEWKTIFPETHKYIFKYKSIPYSLRIMYWFAAHTSLSCICFLIDLKLKIKYQIKNCMISKTIKTSNQCI